MKKTLFIPPVAQITPMQTFYRERFEALVKGTVSLENQAILRQYLRERVGGRLCALNAVPALRSHHLDSLYVFKRK